MAPSDLRRLLCLVLVLLAAVVAAGCASQSDAQAAQLSDLSQQVRRLQATTDRLEERLSAIEIAQRATALPNKSTPVMGTRADAPPDLPIVKMEPRSEMEGGAPHVEGAESDEPRTLIVGEGARVEARSSPDAAGSSLPKRGKDKPVSEPSSKKQKSVTETGSAAP